MQPTLNFNPFHATGAASISINRLRRGTVREHNAATAFVLVLVSHQHLLVLSLIRSC